MHSGGPVLQAEPGPRGHALTWGSCPIVTPAASAWTRPAPSWRDSIHAQWDLLPESPSSGSPLVPPARKGLGLSPGAQIHHTHDLHSECGPASRGLPSPTALCSDGCLLSILALCHPCPVQVLSAGGHGDGRSAPLFRAWACLPALSSPHRAGPRSPRVSSVHQREAHWHQARAAQT